VKKGDSNSDASVSQTEPLIEKSQGEKKRGKYRGKGGTQKSKKRYLIGVGGLMSPLLCTPLNGNGPGTPISHKQLYQPLVSGLTGKEGRKQRRKKGRKWHHAWTNELGDDSPKKDEYMAGGGRCV